MVKYSFLVPTWNNIHFTERCLLSLFVDLRNEKIPLSEIEILILDSQSIDGIKELADHYPGANIRIISFKNDTFSRKNNVGAKEAKGQYLIFLNNDVEILQNLVRPMENALQDPSIGIVGNKHFFPDRTLNHVGIAYTTDRLPIHLYPGERDRFSFFKKDRPVPAVTGACAMVRRKEFLQIGGFDETYVYGYEDVDLCLKYLHELKKTSYFVHDSQIIHFGQSSYNRDRGEENNRIYFSNKWKSVEMPHFTKWYRKDFYLLKKLLKKLIPHIRRHEETLSAIDHDEKTIVFFFDDTFNSFNVVLKNLYNAFTKEFAGSFKIIHDLPDNFPRYQQSKAITVTYTHFWKQYFHGTRYHADRDLRLFAINYERTKDSTYLDFFTRHIQMNQFKVLAVSNYCKNFLMQAGVEPSRIEIYPHGYWPEFERLETKSRLNKKTTYLIITNSNDPGRYNTELALNAFKSAFDSNRDQVSLIIKDYGSDHSYVSALNSRILAGFDVEIITRFLDNPEFTQLFSRADIFLAPFRGEGFGIKILEAGVAGLPVVCPTYGGPIDFLTDITHVPIYHTLSPVGNTIDSRLLFLDDSYVDCSISCADLTESLRLSFKNAASLKEDANKKMQNVRKKYSWSAIAGSIKSNELDALKTSEVEELNYQLPLTLEIGSTLDPEVSILINSYNRPDKIEQLLTRLKDLPDLKKIRTEIVLVDDGSDQDYRPVLNHFSQSGLNIRYIRYEKNRGMTYSKNVALATARGKVSLFMGDDIIPLPGFVSRRLNFHERDPYAVVLGHTEWTPAIRNNLIAEYSTKYSSYQFNYEEFRNESEPRLTALYTSNVSFSTGVLRSKGLFFEQIDGLLFYEDSLWGLKLENAGFHLLYDRKNEALHDHPVDYRWLVQRSFGIGRHRTRLYLKSPASDEITGMARVVSSIQKSEVFLGQERTSDDGPLETIEDIFERRFFSLEREFKGSSDFHYRERLRKLIHELLEEVIEYYTFKGSVYEFGLETRLHDRLFLKASKAESNENRVIEKLKSLRYPEIKSIVWKTAKETIRDLSRGKKPSFKEKAVSALLGD